MAKTSYSISHLSFVLNVNAENVSQVNDFGFMTMQKAE